MSKVKSKVTTANVPWWLGGAEACPHCGQLYFTEIEFRCTECDAPMCPHCKVRHTEGHLVCPDCAEPRAHG